MEVKIALPEEEELGRFEREQSALRDRMVSAEVELHTLNTEIGEFQQRYFRAVGALYETLDALHAKVARRRAERSPSNEVLQEQARAAEARAKQSSSEARRLREKERPLHGPVDPELRSAYRRAMKLMHPDLAVGEAERRRRTRLVAMLNVAYERRDLNEILRLVREFGEDPEAVPGEDIGAQIVRAIRRIAQLRRRLSELETELDLLKQSELHELKTAIEAEEKSGRDPLGGLARRLKGEISEAELALRNEGSA